MMKCLAATCPYNHLAQCHPGACRRPGDRQDPGSITILIQIDPGFRRDDNSGSWYAILMIQDIYTGLFPVLEP